MLNLHGSFVCTHLHGEVVDGAGGEDESEEEGSHVGDVDSPAVALGGREGAQSDSQRHGQHEHGEQREYAAADARHARPHRRHLAAVRAAHRRVLQ